GRGCLAHLHQYRVLTGLEWRLEAMPIEADAVAPFLETEDLLAVDPYGHVIVSGTAELGLDRCGDAELGIREADGVVGIAQRVLGGEVNQRLMAGAGAVCRLLGAVAYPANLAPLPLQL